MKPQHITNGPKPFLRMTNRLRDMRLSRDMTQHAIAEELDMPRGTYAQLEAGVALPSDRMLNDLMSAFKCKNAELYAGVYLDIIKMESDD